MNTCMCSKNIVMYLFNNFSTPKLEDKKSTTYVPHHYHHHHLQIIFSSMNYAKICIISSDENLLLFCVASVPQEKPSQTSHPKCRAFYFSSTIKLSQLQKLMFKGEKNIILRMRYWNEHLTRKSQILIIINLCFFWNFHVVVMFSEEAGSH